MSPGGGYGFPNIMQGQTYGEGPTAGWAPIQVRAITSWPITWTISGTDSTGGWNASIEFWATTYDPASCTGFNAPDRGCRSAGRIDQADGTELMIWLGTNQGEPAGLQPLGPQVTIGGVLWNIYVRGLWGPNMSYDSCAPNCPPISWNYIAYLPANGVRLTSINANFKEFFDDAKNRSPGSTPYNPNSHPNACQNGTQGPGQCIYDTWYVTSVQAGFELNGGGVGLTSNGFSSSEGPSGCAAGTFPNGCGGCGTGAYVGDACSGSCGPGIFACNPQIAGQLDCPMRCGTMSPGDVLSMGDRLNSPDGRFTLALGLDSNLVLYQDGVGQLWSTATSGAPPPSEFDVQLSGGLILMNSDSTAPYWLPTYNPGFPFNGDAILWMQNDGNLVLYRRSDGTPFWASNTCCH
jgi:hypothetical protein